MCGICGFINFDKSSISENDLMNMNNELEHRGPDDDGIMLNRSNAFGVVGLAQKRLSIIDLSPKGHQPMCDVDEKVWVTFNGEIYNFQEIKEELLAAGFTFKSTSDTEVIIYAYKKWGIKCIEKFNGMFAFGLWDRTRHEFYLVRDRLGIKPLYYYHDMKNFIFASELKAIIKYPGFDKKLAPDALAQYLLFQYVPHPLTIYQNTYKLSAGSYLKIGKNGNLKKEKYWDLPTTSEKQLKNISEVDALDELEKLLLSSIKYRKMSDVPLESSTFRNGISKIKCLGLIKVDGGSPC